MHIFLSGECKDYSTGAKICAAIASKVYLEMTKGWGDMFMALKNEENFKWTQSPQVREISCE